MSPASRESRAEGVGSSDGFSGVNMMYLHPVLLSSRGQALSMRLQGPAVFCEPQSRMPAPAEAIGSATDFANAPMKRSVAEAVINNAAAAHNIIVAAFFMRRRGFMDMLFWCFCIYAFALLRVYYFCNSAITNCNNAVPILF